MTSDAGSNAVYYRDPILNAELFKTSPLSMNECIKPGIKVDDWFELMVKSPFSVQRLTERTYFVGVAFYNSIFYVGQKGVLLINPLSGGATPNLIAAIAEITPLPIDTMVYTHYHLDHVEGAREIIKSSNEMGHQLNIVSTDITHGRIEKFESKIPLPNKVVNGHDAEFKFEDITIRMRTPEDNGHCKDNSMVFLKDEQVVQFDDMLNPGMFPFPKFATQEDILAYEENLEELYGYDWNYVNGGHGNIGGREDVRFYLDYLKALRASTEEMMESINLSEFIVPTRTHMSQWLSYLQAVSAAVKEQLRGKYGQYYGFEESLPTHVEMMVDAIVSY